MADTLRYIRADPTPVPAGTLARQDDPRLASRLVALDGNPNPEIVRGIVLGVADDRGVGLNGGRMGAAEGPARFREFLARLPAPTGWPVGAVLNAGDLMPAEHTAETHARLAEVVVVLRGRFPQARLVVVGEIGRAHV